MEHATDELQGDVECVAAREVLQWLACGRRANTFTHPTPSELAKPPKPNPFRSILVNNTHAFLQSRRPLFKLLPSLLFRLSEAARKGGPGNPPERLPENPTSDGNEGTSGSGSDVAVVGGRPVTIAGEGLRRRPPS